MPIHLNSRALRTFQSRLLAWFRAHHRELPWRESRDPYRIWVAEIMLQQTRIAAVIPYYERFLRRFPDVQRTRRAPPIRGAKAMVGPRLLQSRSKLALRSKTNRRKDAGEFPRELKAALSLPGIGRYTAAAVLSIAYEAARGPRWQRCPCARSPRSRAR